MKIHIGPYPKGMGERKIDIQIDRYDTWSMYNNLALIIYPLLLQLKETKHGVPGEFADIGGANHDFQDSFDFYKDTHNESFDESCRRWDEILDKMIWSFGQLIDEDYDSKYHHGEAKFEFVDTEPMLNPVTGKMEVMHQMVDTNPDEHWYDHVGNQLHDERIQEGLELFGKYFRNLWD